MAAYHGVAISVDGSRLPLHTPVNGRVYASEHVDRSTLAAFLLVDEEDVPVLAIHLCPGQRFAYRRRNEAKCGANQQDNGDFASQIVCHLLVVSQGEGDHTVERIAYVVEGEGIVHLASRFDPQHRWLGPVVAVPGDLQAVGVPG